MLSGNIFLQEGEKERIIIRTENDDMMSAGKWFVLQHKQLKVYVGFDVGMRCAAKS